MGVTRISKGRVAIGAVEADGLSVRSLRIPLRPTTSNAQVVTGKKIPPNSAILAAYVKMSTGASAATAGASVLNVGITTATVGLLNNLSIATAGIKFGSLASTAGTLSQGSLVSETTSAGPVAKLYAVDAETEITYATLAPSPNLNGELIIEYRKLG
jgi:hypothetical protein